MKNDMQIQTEVLTELEQDDSVPNGAVGVEVHHGVVKLAGHTNDATMKKSAEMAARRVPGVTKIVLDMGAQKNVRAPQSVSARSSAVTLGPAEFPA